MLRDGEHYAVAISDPRARIHVHQHSWFSYRNPHHLIRQRVEPQHGRPPRPVRMALPVNDAENVNICAYHRTVRPTYVRKDLFRICQNFDRTTRMDDDNVVIHPWVCILIAIVENFTPDH